MSNWQNGKLISVKLTKWQNDETVTWQNNKLRKMPIDKNSKLKKYEIDEILFWWNDKLSKGQVDKME